jgi:NAD(P)-dependent dehydrogenase (short-subunit alcohol dehydrogenase family)
MRLLHDRTALVTGGGGGLGRAYAVALARAGAAVAICDVDEPAAEQTAAAVTREGGRAIAIHADVTRAADFEDAINCAERTLGALDVLLNLAGTFPKNALIDLPEEEWDSVMALNLKSVFLGSRAAIRRMLPRKRGVVLSAASGTTIRGVPRGSAYVASKAAIIGFTRAVGVELEGSGVRILCFAPGPTDTALWRQGRNREDVERRVAARQVYHPDEFSNVVVWLASDLSAPLNGEFINRDLVVR